MIFLSKKKLSIVSAGELDFRTFEKFPLKVGFSADCDMRVEGPEQDASLSLNFDLKGKSLSCFSQPLSAVFMDGRLMNSRREINDEKIHFAVLNGQLVYFCYSKKSESILSCISPNSFIIYDYAEKKVLKRNLTYKDALFDAAKNSNIYKTAALVVEGSDICVPVENITFRFQDNSGDEAYENIKKIDEDFGELICPSCWLHFSAEDINYIAVHASLTGDPLLGEDEKLRFLPVKYNSAGVPLDPMGVPAREKACPHCHRRLPSTFMQMKNDIVSLVGAPSSGKSYYLSILLHYIPGLLYKNYKVAFVDADPPLNAVINTMKNNLFCASSREEHFLAKTQLEGGMYDRLVRHGKKVSLPKPFVYIMRDLDDAGNQTSITFYDNAGEHFEPNINIDDSPGALHVAYANAIAFLFDPLSSIAIKNKLTNCSDPQLERESIDQQAIILAEMSNRIKQIRNSVLDFGIPFAFIVNKCDAIKSLLDYSQFEDPVSKGVLDISAIERNSERVRNFLMEFVPEVVVNADMVSSNVMYFIASPFGHSPHTIKNEAGETYIAPDVSKINPIFIEQPFLWLFSQLDGNPLNGRLSVPDNNSMLRF